MKSFINPLCSRQAVVMDHVWSTITFLLTVLLRDLKDPHLSAHYALYMLGWVGGHLFFYFAYSLKKE